VIRATKTIMKTIWCILFLAVSVDAATYTVKAGGGGDHTTIQACANAMSNGDTCVVYAGTYNEHVSLSAGGVGAYKTLQVNGTDLVYVYDFTIRSHNKIIGFHIQNPSSPNSSDCISVAANTTDAYVTSNSFYACGYHGMIYEPPSSSNTYIYIQGNTFSYSCSTISTPNVCRAIGVNGDYHLIENNDISHVSDGITISGTHNVIRKNTFHDNSISDCGVNAGNCHIDFIESEPNTSGGLSRPSQYNVYEANTELYNLGSDGHGYLAQGDACNGQCYNLIIRFNIGAHVGSGGILDDNAGNSSVPGFSYVKSYNNTWVDFNQDHHTGAGEGTNSFMYNSTHGSSINELFYYPESVAYFFPYATDSSTGGTFSASHNLAWCTGTCDFRAGLYSAEGAFAANAPGNQVADPKFANYASNNFQLASGSPAIGAGTYLTTVASSDSGSGTSLVVNDASFFQDGYGIAGVNGDCISVGTVTIHVCISSINYQTNTITLTSGITRSAGNPVWLYSDSTGRQVLFGSAPNIGATFQAVSPLTPPTNLTAVPQ
jgi:hypothetical protein